MINACKLDGYSDIGSNILIDQNHMCCFTIENKLTSSLIKTNTSISDNDLYTGIGIVSSVILMFIFALVIDRCIHKILKCNYYIFTAVVAFVVPYGLLIPYFKYVIINENLKMSIIIVVGVWSGIILIGTVIICYLKRRGLCRRICECCNIINEDQIITQTITHAINYDSDYNTQIHEHIDATIVHFNPHDIPSSPDSSNSNSSNSDSPNGDINNPYYSSSNNIHTKNIIH